MVWTGFMSHAQADGAGAVGTLFFAFAKFGLTNWLDMRQQDITLEGMKKGVRDSRIFLLFLTKVNTRTTCKCHCVWQPCVFTPIALAPAGPGLLVLPAGDARGDPLGQEGADRSGGGAAIPSVRDGGVARAGRAGRAASRVRSLQ